MMFAAFIVSNNNIKASEEMVIINANSNGEPTNVYEFEIAPEEGEEIPTEPLTETKQFTRTRDISITIKLDETLDARYVDEFEVCEIIPEGNIGNSSKIEMCSNYSLKDDVSIFQLSSRNDGEKTLAIRIDYYLLGNNDEYNVPGAVNIEKKITLDTTGPVITLTGGEYVYIPKGETYVELNATCEDDSGVVAEGGCAVVIEETKINMRKTGYQYIRYTATDFLGNETTVLRKVMVEVVNDDGGGGQFWFFAGGALIITILTVTYFVIKNKEKQKNQSVL